eukprot:3937126-Rhodomonas_salina.3
MFSVCLDRWEGSTWAQKQCLFDPAAFFTALEVNYPALISPITMIPTYVPISKMQRMYQDSKQEMRFKSGAFSKLADTAGGIGIPIEKETFSQPMILVGESALA